MIQKMKVYKILILLISMLLILGSSSFAQKKRAITRGADEAFEDERYSIAVEKYQKAYTKTKGNKSEKDRITYQLAQCYRKMGEYKRAKAYYKRLIRANYERKDSEILLYYANILKMNGDIDEAREYYNQFAEKMPEDPRGLSGAQSCDMIQDLIDNPTKHEIEYIKKINTRESDFAPTFASDNFNDLIFTSTRDGSTGDDKDEWTDQNFSDLYYSRIDRKGEWSEPILLTTEEESINSDANEGSPTMNAAFNRLYFTRCPNVDDRKNGCQIYTAKKSGRAWGQPEMVKLSNDSSNVFGHPTLSSNELIIYFSSDRKGGYGGKDIWVAFRDSKDGEFSVPYNLGETINTPGDELFPYIRHDTILYFASDAHPGLGGLDIFYTTLDTAGSWTIPANMMYPMNSTLNDFGITFHQTEERGFFSSDRRGKKGQEDIYSFIIPPLEFTIAGTVSDDRTLQLVLDANITLTGSDGISVSTRTNAEGYYLFGKSQVLPNTTYDISVTKDNFFNTKTTLTTVGEEFGRDFIRDFVIKPIPEEPIILPEILYDLAKWNLKPQYEDSLQGLITTMDENPRIVVELASHTDSRDTYERNDLLSQRRAQSVVDYLILRGIDADRMIAKGYGERQPRKLLKDMPRAGYEFKEGDVLDEEYIAALSSDEVKEAAHQLNRRSEFRIIRKDYIPKSSTSPDEQVAQGQVRILLNPEDNIVKFKTEAKTGTYIIPCIINGYNDDFYYEQSVKAQVSVEKALSMLKKGIIDKEDFRGDPTEILGLNTIKNNAVFIIKELRIGGKTIEDVEIVVSHRLQAPLAFGSWLLNKFGAYKIDAQKLQIEFTYD